MIIAQVCLRLAKMKGHSKMCSFITQHNATYVASFEGAWNWHANCRNVHQSCCLWIECSFIYHKPSPKAFQRIWQYIQPASQPPTTCNHTSLGPPHPASSPPRSSETSHPDSCCNRLEWAKAHIRWCLALWRGVDNEHRCILLMAFWMYRDTVTRSWGPLLCHSSMTITSCCSMIIHCPMLQGSVHNFWNLKTSQFLHGQHTHWTCNPLSMFGMLWIGVYDGVFQFRPKSSNFAQPLNRCGPSFHRPQPTTWSILCEGDVLHCVRQIVVTPDTAWFSDPPGPPQYSKTAHFRVAFYCGQTKAHNMYWVHLR